MRRAPSIAVAATRIDGDKVLNSAPLWDRRRKGVTPDYKPSHGRLFRLFLMYNKRGAYLRGATARPGAAVLVVLSDLRLLAAAPAAFPPVVVARLEVFVAAAAVAAAAFARAAPTRGLRDDGRAAAAAVAAVSLPVTFSWVATPYRDRIDGPAARLPTAALDHADAAAAPLLVGAAPGAERTRPTPGALPTPFNATGSSGDLRRARTGAEAWGVLGASTDDDDAAALDGSGDLDS